MTRLFLAAILLFCWTVLASQENCGSNGIYSKDTRKCICVEGYGGTLCDECAMQLNKGANHTYLCCKKPRVPTEDARPKKGKKDSRVLVLVKSNSVKKLVAQNKLCIFPGDENLDCACRNTGDSIVSGIGDSTYYAQMGVHNWLQSRLIENRVTLGEVYDSFVNSNGLGIEICEAGITNSTGTTIFIVLVTTVAVLIAALAIWMVYWSFKGNKNKQSEGADIEGVYTSVARAPVYQTRTIQQPKQIQVKRPNSVARTYPVNVSAASLFK